MLACTDFPANAHGVKLPCRHEYAPVSPSVCPALLRMPDLLEQCAESAERLRQPRLRRSAHSSWPPNRQAEGHNVTHAGETDFAVIVYREEDHWKAAALQLRVPAGDLSIFADLELDEMETLDELEQQIRHGWDFALSPAITPRDAIVVRNHILESGRDDELYRSIF
jgi:hypothetical protein